MNLHPLVVHFPIALLIVGTLCDAIGIVGKRIFFQQAGYLLFSLGAVASIAAALTGDQAADVAQHILGITEDLDDHDTLGTVTTLLALAITLGRTHLTFKKQFTEPLQYIYLLLAIITAALVGIAGYTGGHLVYHHGAGTQPVIQQLDIQPKKTVPKTNTFESQ